MNAGAGNAGAGNLGQVRYHQQPPVLPADVENPGNAHNTDNSDNDSSDSLRTPLAKR